MDVTRSRVAAQLPAAARLGPLEQVVDGAEAVGDAVLAAVADEQHVDLAELLAAVRAADRPLVGRAPGSSSSPASQCAPWIAQGTTCSSRQKAARRSPAGSNRRGSRRPLDVRAAPGAALGGTA